MAARLEERRTEIVNAVISRINEIPGTPNAVDPEYVEGLRVAASAAVDLWLGGIERADTSTLPLPVALHSQARLAARNGIRLGTVTRRYLAANIVLDRILSEEAEDAGLLGTETKKLRDGQAALLERLIGVVTDEYERELGSRPTSEEQRRAQKVRKLLAEEHVDTDDLRYEFNSFHVGVVARGAGAAEVAKGLASAWKCSILVVRQEEGIWAWLGTRDRPDLGKLDELISLRWPTCVPLSIGAPAKGIPGWRRTHRQASAAFHLALRSPGNFVRYSDEPLLASILQDDLALSSLRELYLDPLSDERDGGLELRLTLRTYLANGRNGASTSLALDVSRQTITNRLRKVEARIGRPLTECGTGLEVALRLEELGALGPFSANSLT